MNSSMRCLCTIMRSFITTASVLLYVAIPCGAEFHPLYQAMLGDPTVRLHPLTYGPSELNGRNLTSLFVYPNFPGPFQAVIIAPDADGRNSFEDGRAVALARHGYAALAADMHYFAKDSDSDLDGDREQSARAVMLKQYLLAYKELRQLPFIRKIASIGYGLGGLTLLDAVRINAADISAVICVHSILRPLLNATWPTDESSQRGPASTKLLILNGWNDPLNPKDTVDQTLQELDRLDIDWQLHVFSQAKHAFSLPHADVDNITQFNAPVSRYAWTETLMFLESSLRAEVL